MEYPPFVLPFDQSTKPATIKPTHDRVASRAVDSATGDTSYAETETETETGVETDILSEVGQQISTAIFG